MSPFPVSRRTAALVAVLGTLLVLFVWVALRSGPLAPVPVTVAEVESRAIAPALFGIGTVEARYTYRIGPTVPGRVLRVDVEVGDRVAAGQVLGEMDPVDLDQRLAAQDAAIRRAEYGTGSSRDWAAKGTMLLGVKAVIAKSFERIHRSNLAGMGVLPLQFAAGEDAQTLGLTGKETFDVGDEPPRESRRPV
jgi:hypothetical protein